MVSLFFGEREVGRIDLNGENTGIGKFIAENGVDSLLDLRHYGVGDGEAFLDAVTRVFAGEYFKAVRVRVK
jgi:hypothetical protein